MIQSNEAEQNCIHEQTFTESLLEEAKKYFAMQVNVVAVKQKKPLAEWAKWQTQKQTKEEFENQPWHSADGFGIICGTKASNELFYSVVDFDVKNVSEQAQALGREILKKLLCTQIEKTPSGGQHWIYQTHNKPRTSSSHHSQCGLELLGEGKLCIMAPSQGSAPAGHAAETYLVSTICAALLQSANAHSWQLTYPEHQLPPRRFDLLFNQLFLSSMGAVGFVLILWKWLHV